jgi:hypothetical protein
VKPAAPESAGTPPYGQTVARSTARDASSGAFPDPLARYRYALARGGVAPALGLRHNAPGIAPSSPTRRRWRPRHLAGRPWRATALPPIWSPADRTTTPAITEAFVEAYRAAGGLIEHAHFPDARHSFVQQASPDTDKCVALVRDFVGRQLGRS